ncbi:MAG: NAD(P)H-binding protein [Gammaproteobacteria bacterium]|nr:NAD(P)H-binding protein [Gammaproteobacteria bacterium]
MQIALTGATGFIGRRLCVTLAQDNHRVRALARNREAAARLLDPRTEILRGDLDSPEALRRSGTWLRCGNPSRRSRAWREAAGFRCGERGRHGTVAEGDGCGCGAGPVAVLLFSRRPRTRPVPLRPQQAPGRGIAARRHPRATVPDPAPTRGLRARRSRTVAGVSVHGKDRPGTCRG